MNRINDIAFIENKIDSFDLTNKVGMNSYKYEKSKFIDYFLSYLKIADNATFFDLGSGYGEVLIPFAKKFIHSNFIGIELVKLRYEYSVKNANQRLLSNLIFKNEDLLTSDLSFGDYFYIYNPIFEFQYPLLLNTLHSVALKKKITIISESKSCYYFDSVEWLSEVHCVNETFLTIAKVYKSK